MTIKIKGKTMLVIAAGAGMILTAWLAAKNTTEAKKRKEDALAAKREATGDENAELTFFESAKAQIGAYIPAIISGTVTLGSLVGSEFINKDMLKKAEKAVDDFKSMTDQLEGKGSSKIIEKAVEQKKLDDKANKSWDQEEQFRIEFQNQVIEFKKTRTDVIESLYNANRCFVGRGILTFNEFLEILGQESVEGGDDRGWEAYIGETVYGYVWIDFGLSPSDEDPDVTDIHFAVYPHFFDEASCEEEIDEGCVKQLPEAKREADPEKSPDDIPVKLELTPPW